jgi:hypothetical protein
LAVERVQQPLTFAVHQEAHRPLQVFLHQAGVAEDQTIIAQERLGVAAEELRVANQVAQRELVTLVVILQLKVLMAVLLLVRVRAASAAVAVVLAQ